MNTSYRFRKAITGTTALAAVVLAGAAVPIAQAGHQDFGTRAALQQAQTEAPVTDLRSPDTRDAVARSLPTNGALDPWAANLLRAQEQLDPWAANLLRAQEQRLDGYDSFRVTSPPVVATAPSGGFEIDWPSVGIGIGSGLVLALLGIAAAVLRVRVAHA